VHYTRFKCSHQVSVKRYGQASVDLDNAWVVPYNPTALLRFNCHINVEVTTTISVIKYLTTYLEKGPDMIEVHIFLYSSPLFSCCFMLRSSYRCW
jgi:hypothetical protein